MRLLVFILLVTGCSQSVSFEHEQCYEIQHHPTITDDTGNPIFYQVEVPCSDQIEVRPEAV